MKVIGLVEWIDRDKRGNPIAGVHPLIEIQKGVWRSINATEEFPSQGQVFWPNAQTAVKDSMVIFRAEPNSGQKDEFMVVDPKSVFEVLDLRRYGTPAEVRATLIEGFPLPGPLGTVRVWIWCKADVLVGPVELTRGTPGVAKLIGTNLHRVAAYTRAEVRSVTFDRAERFLRVDDAAPSSYVDWDEDAVVLRRALEAAMKVAKQNGHDAGQTKKQVEDAVRSLSSQGLGPDAQLDHYRLERAIELLGNADLVARSATELVGLMREHPGVKASLDELGANVRADVEQSVRAELVERLARERTELEETVEAYARTNMEFEARKRDLLEVEGQLAQVRSQVLSAANEAEAAMEARVLAALERPLDLLAEVSVLRPFLGSARSSALSQPTSQTLPRLDWSRTRGEDIRDKAALRRILTSAARSRGVDPSLMLQIHAATCARLMPVTLGSSALASLAAYAHGVCGGRLLVVHVSPSAIHIHDLDDVPGGGLVAATAAARDIDGMSLVILEGANRSPLEASVLPLLQLTEIELSPLSSARGLRLAASLVAGATTVPVTPQFWSHSAAIYPEPISPSPVAGTPGDIALSSELFALGDEPTQVIDALIDAWPDCRELRPTMNRFGSALARFYEDESRISDALLSGLVLPYIATALTSEEQIEALSKAGDTDGSIGMALRRARRKLA